VAWVLLWIFAALAGFSLWVVIYALFLSNLQESRDQAILYGQIREELSLATAPIGGVISPGSPVAVLEAPTLGLKHAVIVEGSAAGDLQSGPGHLRSSVLPGQAGVSVVLGRSVTFGAPFAGLAKAKPGQTFQVVTGQGTYTFRIDRIRRPGDPLPAPVAAGGSRMVLVSSAVNGWRAGWAPDQTVYLDATLQGTGAPVPAGRMRAVPAAEQAMAADSQALTPLVLWLQMLVLVGLALVWAQRRWGSWQTWVVGVPMLVAVLWGVTENLMTFMPNLI
jgi:sortase A